MIPNSSKYKRSSIFDQTNLGSCLKGLDSMTWKEERKIRGEFTRKKCPKFNIFSNFAI